MQALLRRLLASTAVTCGLVTPLASLHAAEAAVPAADAAPAAPVMIADLTQNIPGIFSYGTWEGKLAVQPNTGLVIQGNKGAQGSGGLGHDIATPLDFSKVQFIEVALATRNNNEVPQYAVAFNDADGTLCSARIRVDQIMPGTPVWFRLKLSDFTPVGGTQAGKDPKMDWTKIAKWHFQGDFSTAKPAQVVFIAVRARQ